MTTLPVSPLRNLARSALFRRWAVANLFARLPVTMNLLALVLAGEAVTGSLGTGATLAGILALTAGALAMPRGRALDRTDLRAGVRRDLLLSALVMGGLVVAVVLHAPVWVLAVLAATEGAASAALLGGFRTLLIPAVTAEQMEPANALDAVFVEVAFVAGPAIAGVAALVVGPVGVLAMQTASFVIAALLLGGLPTRLPVADRALPGPAPARTRGATSVYLLAMGMGLCLGAFEATIPARITAFGLQPASAGPLMALAALGSGIGGMVAANRRDPLRHGRRLAGVLMLIFACGVVPSAVVPSVLLLGIALFVFGLPIAPLNALGGLALQRTVAVPRQAEGFSLYAATILIGAGAGQALAGQLLARVTPTQVILVLAVEPATLGLAVTVARVRRAVRGMAPGVGYPHDPVVTDPAGHVRVT